MHSKISFLAVSQVAPLQPFRKKSSSIQTVFLAGSTEIKPLRLLVVQQLQPSALTFESEYEPLPVFSRRMFQEAIKIHGSKKSKCKINGCTAELLEQD